MQIKRLHVENLRILEKADIYPAPGINFITGDNGAGKTSLLEAIYLLGRGKSFRHRDSGPFIRTGCKHSIVVAEIKKDDGSSTRLGVERANSGIRVKQDGKEVLKRSILLKSLPLQIIAPKSHELIEKGPESRRNFMDYGMFHVEHGYLERLTEYSKALKQRNAALRSCQIDVVRSYNPVLESLANKIQCNRQSYIDTLSEILHLTLQEMEVQFSVSVRLNAGMSRDQELELQLRNREALDLKRGHTSVGIHRADLVVLSDNVLAAHRLSRGQQKILVYALKIAQSRLFQRRTNISPILMVDDLTAELDGRHLKRMLHLLDELMLQVFVTLVSREQVAEISSHGMFHVEHGQVNQVL